MTTKDYTRIYSQDLLEWQVRMYEHARRRDRAAFQTELLAGRLEGLAPYPDEAYWYRLWENWTQTSWEDSAHGDDHRLEPSGHE